VFQRELKKPSFLFGDLRIYFILIRLFFAYCTVVMRGSNNAASIDPTMADY
jgi:hypothetical protein